MGDQDSPVAPSSSSIHKGSQPPQHEPEPQQDPPQQVQRTQSNTKASSSKEPSFFVRALRAIFGFRKTSLTLFVALTYLFVFLAPPLAKSNSLRLPAEEPAILGSAWLDLQTISQKPHPYVSRANDEVHDYLLRRVKQLSKLSKLKITVEDDMATGLNMFDIAQSWKNSTRDFYPLHYYESSNVLVRIEGTDPKLEGVLLSAHYDSVPTAYGTTDDGTGIASLLGVLEHYARTGERPLRTIVFNFNNNEEFGLFGAQVFFNHPWSKDVKYVINLEGTGTGERAILFRTTDYDMAKLYSSVRSPFASSIFQQAFASGLIRSETDYRVYAQHGMRGFDIAFYKPRSLYHTVEDSVRHTSKNALWHMLSNTLDLTNTLANAEAIGSDEETPGVYFDFLGIFFFVVPLTWVVNVNIILLAAAPIAMIFFGIIISKRNIWSVGFSFLRLPIAWALATAASKFVSELIYHFNPYIVSSDFTTPLVTLAATFLFVNYAVLTVSQALWPVHDLKLVIVLELFVAHWFVLACVTGIESSTTSASGYYLLTIYYILYAAVAILGLFGISVASPRAKRISKAVSSYGAIGTATSGTETFNDTDESAPLLSNSIPQFDSDSGHSESVSEDYEAHPEHNSFTYDWSLQYLILVPVITLLTYTSVQLCLEGLNQTVQESLQSHKFVYLLVLHAASALVTPLVPFSYKMNFVFAVVLIGTIVGGGFTSIFKEPFTAEAPLKFRVAQTIDLSNGSIPYFEAFGRSGFLSGVLSDLPSVKAGDTPVTCLSQGDGNELCHFASERPYLLDGTTKANEFASYLDVSVVKSKDSIASPYSPMKVELNITALDNRFCYMKFNSTSYSDGNGKSPVRIVTYFNDKISGNSSVDHVDSAAAIPVGASKDNDGNDVFKWLQGIDEIHIHKLNWDQNSYHVGLQWVPKWLEDGEEQQPIDSPDNALGVHVSCYWGEYDQEVMVDGVAYRKIPAYDELLLYTPDSTSWSNRFEGLVRVDQFIEL